MSVSTITIQARTGWVDIVPLFQYNVIPLLRTDMVIALKLVVLIVAVIVWRGIVVSMLWNWFIPPTFNVPELSIVTAIGISLTVNVISPPASLYASDDKNHWAGAFLVPAAALLYGWIAVNIGT